MGYGIGGNMPLKNGHATPQERRFADVFASTGHPEFSAVQAGYTHPRAAASKNLQRPVVVAEIARIQMERVTSEILPIAVNQHRALLEAPGTPAGAKATLIKLAYDRAFGPDGQAAGKEPHEMTSDELALAIAALQHLAAERAVPIIEGTTQAPSVFD